MALVRLHINSQTFQRLSLHHLLVCVSMLQMFELPELLIVDTLTFSARRMAKAIRRVSVSKASHC